jgi:hypothetical protein
MARTLSEVQADIDAHATPGTQTEVIYELMGELTRFLEKGNAPPSSDCDSKLAALNKVINDQNRILQATKDALHIGDTKTMNQMPEEAARIYTESQKLG